MILVEYTIETTWAHGPYTDTIEFDDEDLEGLKGAERDTVINQAVSDAVANVVSWGWREVKPEGAPS
jgi:hypothetical protein